MFYLTKRALAVRQRATLKKAFQIAGPPKKLGASLMGVETLMSGVPEILYDDQADPSFKLEAPLDPQIPKYKKWGTPGKDLILVSICTVDPIKTVKIGSNLSEEQ